MGNCIKIIGNKIMPDNVYTISLPKSDIIFTRYLYIKDEVKIALLISILNKSDDALFWAYELFYSGFICELFNLLWKIYYDFFYSLNPSFEAYFIKKHKEFLNNIKQDKIISIIVQDLLIREFDTDVFTLRILTRLFETEYVFEKILSEQFLEWLSKGDYRLICSYILELKDTSKIFDIYEIIINIFNVNGLNINKQKYMTDLKKSINIKNDIPIQVNIVARILSFVRKSQKMIYGRKFYITVEDHDIIPYKTLSIIDYKINELLKFGALLSIKDIEMMNLFKLNRFNYDDKIIRDMYLNNWIYHASFSPVWFDRIKDNRGFVDYNNERVNFVDDNYAEIFYCNYNLEPDEQSKEIQNRSIGTIDKSNNWNNFYEKYLNKGLIIVSEDEVEELNNENIIY
jgi:hypothetical protein